MLSRRQFMKVSSGTIAKGFNVYALTLLRKVKS